MTADDRRGIALICMAMACFVANDAMIKWAGQQLPFGQLVFTRGAMAMLWIALACRAMGQPLRRASFANAQVWKRSCIEALGSAGFILSLMHLPLANATAINMAVPLVIVLLAALWHGERVSTRQALAVAVGFAGVLLVIQPASAGFNAYAWLCLAATLCHAVRDLITRRISHRVPSLHITLAGATAVTVLAGLASLAEGWVRPAPQALAVLAAASLCLAAGYHCVIAGMRVGQVGVVTPFRYSGLLFALVLGWVLWGDLPNALAWGGIALLLGSGLYLVRAPRA